MAQKTTLNYRLAGKDFIQHIDTTYINIISDVLKAFQNDATFKSMSPIADKDESAITSILSGWKKKLCGTDGHSMTVSIPVKSMGIYIVLNKINIDLKDMDLNSDDYLNLCKRFQYVITNTMMANGINMEDFEIVQVDQDRHFGVYYFTEKLRLEVSIMTPIEEYVERYQDEDTDDAYGTAMEVEFALSLNNL